MKNSVNYLCFTAEEAGSTVAMEAIGSAPSVSLETSVDEVTWVPFTVGSTVITLNNVGDKVYFRGDNSGFATARAYNRFEMTGKISASGNIMSLVDSTCESLTIPSSRCYSAMFFDCTSLTTAPSLPATTLADRCYLYMFYGCISLTTAPALPATTLAEYCYGSMFQDCTSLTIAPELPATTLARDCYAYMFDGCTSLTVAPELPATSMAESCYLGMFFDCSSLTTAPALPATTLAFGCYLGMFFDCSSLTIAPALPATTLAFGCYSCMFGGCTKLNYIEVAFTARYPLDATFHWVSGVASSGTFKCPAALPKKRGKSNIPSGWTIETY